MAEIGIKIVGEDQASFAFRAVSDSARATSAEVSSLGDTWSNMSNTIASGVIKAQSIIGLFQGALTAAGNAAQGFRSFIQTTVDMNGELEGTRGSFSVLLGGVENANRMLAEMRVAAQTTVLSFEEFRNAGKYLLGFQFEAKDVVQITKDIGAAVYALGAKDQGGMERIIRALGQMKAQGRVSREELNQLAEVGVPALKMLADSFGVTTAQMSQMVRKGTVPVEQAITGLIGQFRELYGASGASMAQNFAVMSSNLGDFVAQAKLAVGEGVFKQFRRDLESLTSIVSSPVFLKLAGLIGERLGGAFRKLNDTAILPAMDALKQFMNVLNINNPNPAILQLGENLNQIFGQLVGQYFGSSGVAAVRNFSTVLQQLGVAAGTLLRGGNIYDVFNQLSQIGQDTAAGRFITNLTQEFANLQTSLQQLQQYMRPIISSIVSELGRLGQSDFIQSILKSFDELFSVTDGKGNKFKLQFGNIVAFVNVSMQNITKSLQQFGSLMSNALNDGKIQPLVNGITTTLQGIVQNIDSWGAQALDNLVSWLGRIFNPSFDSSTLEGKVGDTIGNLKLIIGQLAQAFTNSLGSGLFPELAPRITAIGGFLQTQFGIIAGGLGTYLADRFPIAFEMGFNAIGAAWTNWNDKWKTQLFNDISASIGDPIDRVLNSLGIEGKVTGALQGALQSAGFTNLGERVASTNQKLKEQQALLQQQMSNLPSIGEYFNGLGDITSLQSAFANIQDNSSGAAISAGKAIIANVNTGATAQMPAVANSIGQTATSSLSDVANSLASSPSVSGAWQNVGYSLATAVSRGYNQGYQELVGNIQTTLGIPNIIEKLSENTSQISSINSRITSLTEAINKNKPAGGASGTSSTQGNGQGVQDESRARGARITGAQNGGGENNGTTNIVNNYITIKTGATGKEVEQAASYIFLRGTLIPWRK
jgi:tape measure domain-containing protein